ncbi:hypothetical protein [Janibacter melonis]|uniref:hypothetical protein n=1 Tax=Janibacter melonis TaxID=262209 RepID=UPI00174C03B7|nr:hypothetical protein [Janibacter melonis]
MLNYLDFMVGWFAGWSHKGTSGTHLEYIEGRRDVDKIASTLAAETDIKVGVITIWETGELEAEIAELATQERTYVESKIVTSLEECGTSIANFLRAME